jgi:hypothetical protein
MAGYGCRTVHEHLQIVHFRNGFAEIFANSAGLEQFHRKAVNRMTLDRVMSMKPDVAPTLQLTIFNHLWANMSSRCRDFG